MSASRRSFTPLAAAWLGAAVLLGAAPADAFCRSTTCTGTCPRDDNGCKTTGHALYWPGLCVGFSVQKDGTRNLSMADVRPVIQTSFVAWSDLDCGGAKLATIAFTELADASCHRSEYNPDAPNANIILFQDNKWSYKSVENTLAKTTVTFDHDTGEIYDADIELNYAYNELTVGDTKVVFDLQSILTHEIGHFIGLDHTPDLDATMNASYDQGSISQRTLEVDDIAGACAIYPPSRVVTCNPKPRNGLGSECAAAAAAAADSGGCTIGGVAPGPEPGDFSLSLVACALASRLARRRR